MSRFTFTLPEELHREMREVAKAEGVPMATLCREALSLALRTREQQAVKDQRVLVFKNTSLRLMTESPKPLAPPVFRPFARSDAHEYRPPLRPPPRSSSRHLDEMWA